MKLKKQEQKQFSFYLSAEIAKTNIQPISIVQINFYLQF